MKQIDWNQALVMLHYGLLLKYRTPQPAGNSRKKGRIRRAFTTGIVALNKLIFPVVFTIPAIIYKDDPTRIFILAAAALLFFLLRGMLENADIIGDDSHHDFFYQRPVHGSTYIISRLLVIGVYSAAEGAIFALPGFLHALVILQDPGIAFLTLTAVIASGLLGMLSGAVLYYILALLIPKKHMALISTVIQMVVQLSVMGGILLMRILPRNEFYSIPGDHFVWFTPPGLIASPFHFPLPGPVLFLMLLTLLLFSCAGILGREFFKRQNIKAIESGSSDKSHEMGISFAGKPESAAIRRILHAHVLHDPQFRSGIVAILAQTVFIFVLFLFVLDVPILDPFTAAGRASFSQSITLYLIVLLNLFLLKMLSEQSGKHMSGWIFFTAPADRGLLIREIRSLSIRYILIPYLILYFGIFTVVTGSILHSLMHFLVVGLIYLVITGIHHYLFPVIPFTKPVRNTMKHMFLGTALAVTIILSITFVLIVNLIYTSPFRYGLLVLFLAALLLLIELKGPVFAARKLKKAELF